MKTINIQFPLKLNLTEQPKALRGRVMMRVVDAGPGHPNWARFRCACGHTVESHEVSEQELRRGRPCPKCNIVNS